MPKEPLSLRVRTVEGTARVLRAQFHRHNLRVLGLAVGTFFASIVSWFALYWICCWLFVLAISVFGLPLQRIPRGFHVLYIVTALCALGYALIDQCLTPNAQPRDKKTIDELVSDVVLALPRMTLSVHGTLRAWVRLSDGELLQAAELMHRLWEEKHVPMANVRLQIPDSATAAHILFVLQLTQIVDVHRDETEYSLRLNALRPAAFRRAGEGHIEAL